MNRLITAFLMSCGMFTAIPCPFRKWDEDARGLMLVFLPVVGLLLGGLWAALALLLRLIQLPGALSAALLCCAMYLLTGFVHLDGFMDCCDAILSRRALAERQRILKDPHVGSFAVICLALLLLGGFAAFFDAVGSICPLTLLLLPAVTRANAVFCVQTLAPMQTSQYAGQFSAQKSRTQRVAVCVLLVLLFAVAAVAAARADVSPLICCFAAGLTCQLCCRSASRALGGMSGDISGFSVTLSELCGVICASVLGGILQ